VRNLRTEKHKALLKVLKATRIEAGFRQVDLAEKLTVPQSMISKYESGERRIDFLELIEICDALGISMTEFVQKLDQAIKE